MAYIAKLAMRKEQEETVEIAEFVVEDEGISFNNSPLRIEDLEAAPAKMDDIRAEVQDPLKEINLGTTEQPRLT